MIILVSTYVNNFVVLWTKISFWKNFKFIFNLNLNFEFWGEWKLSIFWFNCSWFCEFTRFWRRDKLKRQDFEKSFKKLFASCNFWQLELSELFNYHTRKQTKSIFLKFFVCKQFFADANHNKFKFSISMKIFRNFWHQKLVPFLKTFH